jgi:hypothetical protein
MASKSTRLLRSSILECYSRRLTNGHSQVAFVRPTLSATQRSVAFSTTRASKAAPSPSYASDAAKSSTATTKPSIDDQSPIRDMTKGLQDEPLILDEGERQVDWTRSFHGLSSQPFSKEAADVLLAAIPFDDVEVKPDGIIYLPEIKYRRILNKAFGPGGWGLAPRGETIVTPKSITREYALVAHGRYVLQHPLTSEYG